MKFELQVVQEMTPRGTTADDDRAAIKRAIRLLAREVSRIAEQIDEVERSIGVKVSDGKQLVDEWNRK